MPAAIATHLPDGVDLVDAAAIPLVSLTGEQLVRMATQATAGQTILVTGALGSVGRAAVHAAKKLGVAVIAGVRARQLAEAESLGASSTLALDDEDAIARLGAVDGVADTVGGETAARLFGKVKDGGRFGYASMLPDGVPARYPTVVVTRIFARPDPSPKSVSSPTIYATANLPCPSAGVCRCKTQASLTRVWKRAEAARSCWPSEARGRVQASFEDAHSYAPTFRSSSSAPDVARPIDDGVG